jgi:hypothetical protein
LIIAQCIAWLASNNQLIDPITGFQYDLLALIKNFKKQNILFLLAGDSSENEEEKGAIKILLDKRSAEIYN